MVRSLELDELLSKKFLNRFSKWIDILNFKTTAFTLCIIAVWTAFYHRQVHTCSYLLLSFSLFGLLILLGNSYKNIKNLLFGFFTLEIYILMRSQVEKPHWTNSKVSRIWISRWVLVLTYKKLRNHTNSRQWFICRIKHIYLINDKQVSIYCVNE